MRKITNVVSSVLRNYRYNDKADPFHEFKKLREHEVIPTPTKGNILILPIRVAPVSNLFEGIYGYALKLRGYEAHVLLCNQALDKCDNIISANIVKSSLHCSLCLNEQGKFTEAFSLIPHSYQSLVTQTVLKELKSLSNSLKISELLDLEYDGFAIGLHIQSAVMRHFLLATIDEIKYERIIREYAFSCLFSYEATKALIAKINPKFVLTSHGVYSTWGPALDACKKMGITSFVWARGYVGGNIIVSKNESYLKEAIFEPNKHWDEYNLTSCEKLNIKNYFSSKRNVNSKVDHVNYYDYIADKDQGSFVNKLPANNKNNNFALFPNIPWDGTSFSSSKTFPSMEIFFKSTIDWFKNHQEFNLIIRAHPAELVEPEAERVRDVIKRLYTELPSNVYFIDADSAITSYEVERISKVCLMYASTMSLELAYTGKTVIQTGQTITSNKGIVFEPKSVEEYKDMLLQAAEDKLRMTEKMQERAEKYAYHWIYRRHIPDNTYEHKGLTFTKFNLNSSMDLAPGKNKVVDWFLDRCEDGQPFIWTEK